MSVLKTTLLILTIAMMHEGCRVGCLARGDQGGWYHAPNCRCFNDTQKYDDFINRRVNLGPSDQIPEPAAEFKQPIIVNFDTKDGFSGL